MKIYSACLALALAFLTNAYQVRAQDQEIAVGADSVVVKGPNGTTVVRGLDAKTAGVAIGSAAKQAGDLGVGIAEAFGQRPGAPLSGEFKPKAGKFFVSIAGNDGSASTYSGCTNVEVLSGPTYNEFANTISYTGKVKFTTGAGEHKEGEGSISLIKMAE